MEQEEELLKSYGIGTGLYRNAASSEVVNVLCVGAELSDPDSKVIVCRRPKLPCVWTIPVYEFCMNYVRVLGASGGM